MSSTILHYPGRIPSLRLPLEDTKIMESSAGMMKSLVPARYRGSIKAYFETFFEDTETHTTWRATAKGAFEIEQLSFQNRSRTLSDFAALASRLAFDNAQISSLTTSAWKRECIEGFFAKFTQGGTYTAKDITIALNGIEPIFSQCLGAPSNRGGGIHRS